MQILSVRHTVISTFTALAAALFLTTGASGQPGDTQTRESVADPLPELPITEAVPLSGEAIDFDIAGLTVPLSEGAIGRVVTQAASPLARITLPEGLGAVIIQQRAERGSVERDQILSALIKQAVGLERVVGTIDPDQRLETDTASLFAAGPAVPVGLRPTRPYYIRQIETAEPGAADRSPAITGLALVTLPSAENESRYALFRLVSSDPVFDRARAHFEAMIASTRIDDPGRQNRRRGSALENGLDAREAFRSGVLAQHAETRLDTWQRLHAPADSETEPGAADASREAGYRRIRFAPGVRGDARGIPPDQRSAADLDRGYVLQMDARLLLDPGAGPEAGLIDSRAVYFLSSDFEEELWTVRTAVRRPNAEPETWLEVGGRSGRSMTVSIDRGQAPARQVRPVIEGEGYISRVTSVLLPELHAITRQAGPDGGRQELAFYAYDQNRERIRLRTDTVERAGQGRYRVRTTFAGAAPQVSLVSGDGTVLRTELPNGLVWEAIEFDALVELWRSKGLPVN